jgi:hypothetical protein
MLKLSAPFRTTLQIAVILVAAVALTVPEVRTSALRAFGLILTLAYFAFDIVGDHRKGLLKLTPLQIYGSLQDGSLKPVSPWRLLASVLGLLALLIVYV